MNWKYCFDNKCEYRAICRNDGVNCQEAEIDYLEINERLGKYNFNLFKTPHMPNGMGQVSTSEILNNIRQNKSSILEQGFDETFGGIQ